MQTAEKRHRALQFCRNCAPLPVMQVKNLQSSLLSIQSQHMHHTFKNISFSHKDQPLHSWSPWKNRPPQMSHECWAQVSGSAARTWRGGCEGTLPWGWWSRERKRSTQWSLEGIFFGTLPPSAPQFSSVFLWWLPGNVKEKWSNWHWSRWSSTRLVEEEAEVYQNTNLIVSQIQCSYIALLKGFEGSSVKDSFCRPESCFHRKQQKMKYCFPSYSGPVETRYIKNGPHVICHQMEWRWAERSTNNPSGRLTCTRDWCQILPAANCMQ